MKSLDYENCFKCQEEDHEGSFCRCEDRNIRIAREKLINNESPWGNLKKEDLKKCKFRKYDRSGYTIVSTDITCEEMRKSHEILKKEYRDKNMTDRILQSGRKDIYYEEFCKSIDDFLDNCKCDFQDQK